jgi:antitoxin MazE
MVKKLKKIGNSQGLIIDKAVLELLKITMDTPLEIETDGQNLIIKPIRESPTDRQSSIAALTNKVSDTHQETFRKLAQ